jgi:hypothetical protein
MCFAAMPATARSLPSAIPTQSNCSAPIYGIKKTLPVRNTASNSMLAFQKPEGQITEVTYMFSRPGPDPKPVPKVSLVTRVDDLGCGVGYYK